MRELYTHGFDVDAICGDGVTVFRQLLTETYEALVPAITDAQLPLVRTGANATAEEREGCNTAFERHGIESVRRAGRSQNLAARSVAPGDGVIYPNRRHISEAMAVHWARSSARAALAATTACQALVHRLARRRQLRSPPPPKRARASAVLLHR